jgi:spore germination protein GerM
MERKTRCRRRSNVRAVLAAAAATFVLAVGACGGEEREGGRLWFVDGYVSAFGMRGKIDSVERQRAVTPARAVGELLKGPMQAERDEGLITAIPRGTVLETISVSNLTARVRLVSNAPSRAWTVGDYYASAQIVYTLTEFDTVDRVELYVNGERCCVYDRQSRPITRPLTRHMFRGWQGDPLPPPR